MAYLDHNVLAQHLLFAFLVVVAPAWDYFDTRRLKRHPNSPRKIRYYRTLIIWLWMATAVAFWSVGARSLLTIAPAFEDAPWLFAHAWVRYLIEAVIAVFMALISLPAAIVLWKKLKGIPRTFSSADAMQSFTYFFPATSEERRWYAFLSVTAGICEETIFRGFLLHYFHAFPFSLNLMLGLLLASLVFGLQHLYQGAAGAASTAVVGLLFGLLFVLTGSLLLPILFHMAMDLRMLLVLRPPNAERRASA